MSETVAELTRTLVEIPSHDGDDEIVDYLADWVRRHRECRVRIDAANNVIARRGSGTPRLALVGHHDVVDPAEDQMAGDRCRIETRGDRLYGRGTADMKGSLAAMARAFVDARVPPDEGEIILASFAGEEIGGVGARHDIDEGFRPDRAIVGEGSTGYSDAGVTDVAVAHKGRRGSTIRVRGSAAHASEPDAGDNAIYRACEVIDDLRSIPTVSTEVHGHGLEGTLVATEIEGGTDWNVVPDRCSIAIDERTVPGARADLGSLVDPPTVEVEVDQDLPPMACPDEDFANAVVEAARGVQSGAGEHIVKPHATDAGWLSTVDVACVICGAAEPGEAHTDSESVSIAALERCRTIYESAIDTHLR